jgi:hypothetical protein
MKHIGLITMSLFLIYSCNSKATKDYTSKTTEISVPDESSQDSLTKTIVQTDNADIISNPGLAEVFSKAVQYFPEDSASLYMFYFKWNSTKDQAKINKQILRLEKLTSKESVGKY